MAFSMTVTARGQFTLNKGSMEHLGIRPGEKVSVSREPDGSIRLAAAKRKLSVDDVLREIDNVMGDRDVSSSLDDINQAIAEGYANAGMRGLR